MIENARLGRMNLWLSRRRPRVRVPSTPPTPFRSAGYTDGVAVETSGGKAGGRIRGVGHIRILNKLPCPRGMRSSALMRSAALAIESCHQLATTLHVKRQDTDVHNCPAQLESDETGASRPTKGISRGALDCAKRRRLHALLDRTVSDLVSQCLRLLRLPTQRAVSTRSTAWFLCATRAPGSPHGAP